MFRILFWTWTTAAAAPAPNVVQQEMQMGTVKGVTMSSQGSAGIYREGYAWLLAFAR